LTTMILSSHTELKESWATIREPGRNARPTVTILWPSLRAVVEKSQDTRRSRSSLAAQSFTSKSWLTTRTTYRIVKEQFLARRDPLEGSEISDLKFQI
jgi:hypothetical protein